MFGITNEAAKRRAVIEYLSGQSKDYNDGWRPQGLITAATGVTGPEMRAICNDFPQTFLGSNKGYKLVREATLEEVNDTLRTLLSRSEKIMHRARSLQRYALERQKVASASARRLASLS